MWEAGFGPTGTGPSGKNDTSEWAPPPNPCWTSDINMRCRSHHLIPGVRHIQVHVREKWVIPQKLHIDAWHCGPTSDPDDRCCIGHLYWGQMNVYACTILWSPMELGETSLSNFMHTYWMSFYIHVQCIPFCACTRSAFQLYYTFSCNMFRNTLLLFSLLRNGQYARENPPV